MIPDLFVKFSNYSLTDKVIGQKPKKNCFFFGKSRDKTPGQKKVKNDMPLMVTDLVYKFQMLNLGCI